MEPQYIAIRTCNRPAYLQRLLLSVSRRQSQTPVCVLVFEDSRDAQVQARNQQIVASADRRFDFSARYLGLDWQAEFMAELQQRLPIDAESTRWSLQPHPRGWFTGGRLFNLITLVLAGRRFIMFDDDFLLDRARHLGNGDSRKLQWSPDPAQQTLAHLSLRESRAAGQEWPHDPIDAHLKFLGQKLQDCLVASTPGSAPLLDATESGPPPDRLQLDKDSVILTSVNGQYGVPIAPNGFYLFYLAEDGSGPAWLNPEQYRILRKGRAVWNVTFGPVIAGRSGSTPSGIDNRVLMPPTLPFCKGEDTTFCALLKFLHPNAAHLYLPWALEHSRTAVPWANATFARPQLLTLAKTIWKKAGDFADSAAGLKTPEQRLELLSQLYLDWANLPVAQLREEIRESFSRGVRWRIKVMSECLARVDDPNSQVYRDLSRGLKQFRSDLEMKNGLPAVGDNPALQGEEQRIQWLADAGRGLGNTLGSWSRIWQAAREMQPLS